jgi:hypothetical protein
VTPSGDRGSGLGVPSLLESLTGDLATLGIEGPVTFCLSGDFTDVASREEFAEAHCLSLLRLAAWVLLRLCGCFVGFVFVVGVLNRGEIFKEGEHA